RCYRNERSRVSEMSGHDQPKRPVTVLRNPHNISSTRWRTVADHKHKQYFFESAVTPNTFWVDLKKLDLSQKTGKVKKLDLGPNQANVYAGEVSARFEESAPFKFEGI
ncbi:hypothetical protein ACFYXR_26280, partial [Pseudomonas qingdaonensis]